MFTGTIRNKLKSAFHPPKNPLFSPTDGPAATATFYLYFLTFIIGSARVISLRVVLRECKG